MSTRLRSSLQPVLVGVVAMIVLAAGLVALAVRRSGSDTTSSRPTAALPTTVVAPESSTIPTTEGALSEPAYVTEAKRRVSELRGLAWKAPLEVDVVSRDELGRRYRAGTERDRRPEREAGDGDTFKVLHLIPEDLDYSQTIDDLFSGLVLGFYDPETKELVVGNSGIEGDKIDIATLLTLVHELDHALTDQWFEFGPATDALEEADREEELDAYIAVLEGDAKLLESRYAERYLSEEEQVLLALGGLGGADEDVAEKLADTPPFLLEYLYFPYDAGLAFAEAQATRGPDPNAGVDAALRNPPTSSEQILHPELYAAGQGWSPPALVDLAAATGCESRRRSSLGEFKMGKLLGTELSRDEAAAGADGWNGDVFETVRCGSSLGLVDRWQADTEVEASALYRALSEWAPGWSGGRAPVDGRFSGPDGAGRIIQDGTRVDLFLADDRATADRLEAAAS